MTPEEILAALGAGWTAEGVDTFYSPMDSDHFIDGAEGVWEVVWGDPRQSDGSVYVVPTPEAAVAVATLLQAADAIAAGTADPGANPFRVERSGPVVNIVARCEGVFEVYDDDGRTTNECVVPMPADHATAVAIDLLRASGPAMTETEAAEENDDVR